MEGIIVLGVFGLLFTFGRQLFKRIGNIFSIFGRILDWVLGIIIIIFILTRLLAG